MSPTPRDHHDLDPVARSDLFDMVLEASPDHLSLVRVVNQHKTIIRWLVAGGVVLFVVSSIAIWAALSARSAAATAKDAAKLAASAAQANYVTCLAGNDFRSTERQLWDFIFTFPPPVGETAAARKVRLEETAKFKRYVKKKFADRPCVPPTRGPGTGPLPSLVPTISPSSRDTRSTGGTSSTATSAGAAMTPMPGSPPASSRPAPSPTTSKSPASHPSSSPSPSPSVCATADHLATVCLTTPFAAIPLGTVSPWPHQQSALTRSTPRSMGANITRTLAVLLVIVCSARFVQAVIAGE